MTSLEVAACCALAGIIGMFAMEAREMRRRSRPSYTDVAEARSLAAYALLWFDPQFPRDLIERENVSLNVSAMGRATTVRDAGANEVPISAETALALSAIADAMPLGDGPAARSRDRFYLVREYQPASATLRAAERINGGDLPSRALEALESISGKAEVLREAARRARLQGGPLGDESKEECRS